MFMSQLKDKLLAYDKYGIHRTNGMKVLFVVAIMLSVELLTNLSNPYFYYFFVPIICLNAEIMGRNLKDKYLFFIYSLLVSTFSIFLFGLFSIYKTFFVVFVFFYCLLIYYLFISKQKNMLSVVPLILGLASYSLIYVDRDVNFYIALNHVLVTLFSGAVVLAGLYVFPKTYNLAIWRRAFLDVATNLEGLCDNICKEESRHVGVITGMVVMESYSKMLPRSVKGYSISKITLHTYELVMVMSYFMAIRKQQEIKWVGILQAYLALLVLAIKNKEKILLTDEARQVLAKTHELQVVNRLISSWNYLCLE